MKRQYEVITVGETTMDAFMKLADASHACKIDHKHHALCFKQGDKVEVDRYDFCLGGNATNVAVGLSRLGIKSALCSEIGDDEFSIKIRNWLARENIERLLVKQTTGAASSFSVIINFDGDRTIFVQDVEREHDFDYSEVSTPFIFLTSLGREWKKPYEKVLAYVNENNCTLAFNPGSRQLREGKSTVLEVLQRSNILFVNKEEAELLLFEKNSDKRNAEYIQELLRSLQRMGPQTVVITDGTHGSYAAYDEEKVYHQGIDKDQKVVERTGAGDSYTSGFIAASLYSLSIPQAMEWGSKNASSVVGQIGAQAGLLTKIKMEEITHDQVEDVVESEEELLVMPAPLK